MTTNGTGEPSSNGHQTPAYVKALLAPRATRGSVRRVWGIDLESVWIPFFTASNTKGETVIPDEALGAPIRLAHSKDGAIRFTQTGRPVTRVAPELNAHITMARENFVAGLQAFTGVVQQEMPDQYGAQVDMAYKAGAPLLDKDAADLAEHQRLELLAKLQEHQTHTPASDQQTPPAETPSEAPTTEKRRKVAAAA